MVLQDLCPLSARVLGHAASKNEEVDQTKSVGIRAKFIEQEYKAPREEGDTSGLHPEFLSLGVFISSFVELS